ncbi:class II glutamine amidotransferase [Nitratireductor sp. XY-223]|uniref:class II glutamine amidotransferase n=1 Tax=Nitratireductor sp. XY-223 TaxID=2561926 RepID=UPI0010A9B34F|nr:class II glutamine amidotransferase [Nitratireductor sp. XY-223]
MCELFGVSTSEPVRLFCNLDEFAKHGGASHANRSGWGVAYYQDNDVLLIREALPAAKSPWIGFLETHGLTSQCTICHVRFATRGAPSIVNTHPFRRELGGRMHVFAHNGGLRAIEDELPFESEQYRPVGQTDSEYAFCLLLQRLAPLWQTPQSGVPALADRMAIVARTASDLRKLGAANFLYADGDVLFAHSDRRRFDVDGEFGELRAPGLCLGDTRELVKGMDIKWPVTETAGILVASVPLTDTGWTPLDEGTVVALRDGDEVARTMP